MHLVPKAGDKTFGFELGFKECNLQNESLLPDWGSASSLVSPCSGKINSIPDLDRQIKWSWEKD